jgi:glutaminyl-tRNA synthetase
MTPLKRPVVYEFSRFDVAGSVLSKRKIKSLIESGKLDGYDDPRLLTIAGLRRRGYTPESLKATVSQLGHTRNTTQMSNQLLENYIREDLNKNAPRAFGILDPLLVVIVEDNYVPLVSNMYTRDFVFKDRVFERPIHPNDPTKGTRPITLKSAFYIERSDFLCEAPKSYYRLTKSQPVRLKYTDGLIHYKFHVCKQDKINMLLVSFTPDTTTKTKGNISWISEDDSINVEYNSFGSLLTLSGDFNEESKKVCSGVFEHLPVEKGDRFQLERVGYYVIDSVNESSITMNEIVGLRENK